MRNGGRDDVFGAASVEIDDDRDGNIIYGQDDAAVGNWRDDIARALCVHYRSCPLYPSDVPHDLRSVYLA